MHLLSPCIYSSCILSVGGDHLKKSLCLLLVIHFPCPIYHLLLIIPPVSPVLLLSSLPRITALVLAIFISLTNSDESNWSPDLSPSVSLLLIYSWQSQNELSWRLCAQVTLCSKASPRLCCKARHPWASLTLHSHQLFPPSCSHHALLSIIIPTCFYFPDTTCYFMTPCLCHFLCLESLSPFYFILLN